MRDKYYQINSIVKVFKLLEVLVTKSEFELTELCRVLKLPKTTIHRMLLTLESLEYVKHEKSRYMSSFKLFELGSKSVNNNTFFEIAHPLLLRLSEKTMETVNLGVLDNDDIIYIDIVGSKHALSFYPPIGSRHKAHQTALGKAILAFLPEEEILSIFSRRALIPSTRKSIKTFSALKEDLKLIRQRGYAVDDEEVDRDVRCTGAPIFDYKGNVIAGLSISGPSSRIKRKDFKRLGKLVIETSQSISRKVGWIPKHYDGDRFL
jgi:IclR family KDG regulon transcriptional repressor